MKTKLIRLGFVFFAVFAGTIPAFAAPAPSVGDVLSVGFSVFLFIWLLVAVLFIGVLAKKQKEREEAAFALPDFEPTRKDDLDESEADPVEELESVYRKKLRTVVDDGVEVEMLSSYVEACDLNRDLHVFAEKSHPLTADQTTRLNRLVRAANASLNRIDGRLLLSKFAKFVIGFYWVILCLYPIFNTVAAFSAFIGGVEGFFSFCGYLIGSAIFAVFLFYFYHATRLAYAVPGVFFEEYSKSTSLLLYEKLWIALGSSTAAGVASAAAYAQTDSVSVSVDSSGNATVYRNSNAPAGLAAMGGIAILGVATGGIIFFVVQPFLMMWLFKKYYIDVMPEPEPETPFYKRPKFPMWASPALGGILGILASLCVLITIWTDSDDSDRDFGGEKTEISAPATTQESSETTPESSETPVPESSEKTSDETDVPAEENVSPSVAAVISGVWESQRA